MEEVLLCERELYQNYAVLESLPVFLNLTFEEICFQAKRDYKMFTLIIIKQGDNFDPVRRICSMLQTLSVDLYYWMACMESASVRRVISKFGLNNHESQIFFLAPTSARPVLVERFSGQTLANINMGDIEDCIQQGQLTLQNLKKKC